MACSFIKFYLLFLEQQDGNMETGQFDDADSADMEQ